MFVFVLSCGLLQAGSMDTPQTSDFDSVGMVDMDILIDVQPLIFVIELSPERSLPDQIEEVPYNVAIVAEPIISMTRPPPDRRHESIY